jgi:hypothetical protein
MSIILLVSSALAAAAGAEADNGMAAELTTFLANADSIDRVDVRERDVAFTIESKGETYRVTAMVHDREIVAVALVDFGRAVQTRETGAYSWIAHELAATRIATLQIGSDGKVTVGTTSGAHFAIVRDTSGNASSAARWAAAWDSTDARE